MTTVVSASVRPSRWRRRIAILLFALALAVAGLAAWSQTALFRDWLRRQVLARVNATLVGKVAIGGLAGNLFGRLVATDLRVSLDGQRVLAVRRLVATYDLPTLLRGGALRITSLDADGVALQLVADERGWNVERLVRTTDAGSALTVDLQRIRLRNAALRILRPGRAWRLRGLTLDAAGRFEHTETRLAIHGLAFDEITTGIRVEELVGRFLVASGGDATAEDVRLRTTSSTLEFAGRIGADVEAHVRVTRLAAGDLRALLGSAAPLSDWRGDLHAVGPRAAVGLNGSLQAEVASAAESHVVGALAVTGTIDGRSQPPTGELRMDLAHVDLGGMLGPRYPASDVTGSVRLSHSGETPRAVHVEADLVAPRFAATTLTSLAIRGDVDDTGVRFDLDAAAPAGTARATGTVAPKTEAFELHVSARDVDPARLIDRPELSGRLSGTLTMTGAGFALATTRATAAVTLTPGHLGAVTIASASVAARADGGRLLVDRATLATSAGTAEVSGDVVLGSTAAVQIGELRADARATDLGPLAALFGRPEIRGAATAKVVARGNPSALDATVDLSARGLRGRDWRVSDVDARLATQRFGGPTASADLHGSARDVVLAEHHLTDAAFDAWWRGGGSAGQGGLDLRGREASGRHQLAAEVRRDGEATRVTVTKLRLDHRGDSWTAMGAPVVEERGGRVTFGDFAIQSTRGRARLSGVVGGGASDLALVVDDLDLDVLADVVPPDLRGHLTGKAHLGGTLGAPHLDAEVALAAPTLVGVRYDDLRARVAADGGRAEVHGRLARAAQTLVVDGSIPIRFALSPARFEVAGDPQGRLRAEAIELAFVSALWPGLLTKVGGTITGDVTVGGSMLAPEAQGTITLADGRAYVVPLGLTYDPVDVVLRLEGRAASIERLAIQSGGGRIVGGGDARLTDGGTVMDARFEAQRFPLFANEYGKGVASGWLWIGGTLAAPVLEGSLESDRLVLQVPEVLPTTIRQPDPTIVVIGPGAPPPPSEHVGPPATPPIPDIFERAAIKVQLAVPRDAWVRRSDANVELQGWMTAWKKPGEGLHLAGDIRGVRGWYAFQGKKFTLAEGGVRFSGQGFDPVLAITATHKAGDYLVRLRVGGTVTTPSLTLESEPALEQADVLAVLLFGAPANQLSRTQSVGLREQALGIAGGYVASELRESVANALGVDDLQFDTGTRGLEDARVSVGKYVADDIFVSLAHRFGQSAEELRIEYVIRPGWSLETSTDTLGRSGVDLFWKRRY